MKTVASLALLAGSAAAFSPAATSGRASTAVQAHPFENELGVQAPLGMFDPLGLTSDGNQKKFNVFREAELKHGRVSMLAVTGYLVTAAGIRFPGAQDVPDGLQAIPHLMESFNGRSIIYQMLGFFVLAEIINRDAHWTDAKAEFVGDYRNGHFDLGWDKFDEETKMKKRSIELNNGRAAMMGMWGLVTHETMGVSILPGGYLPGHS